MRVSERNQDLTGCIDSPTFCVDAINGAVGIGTSTPNSLLTVTGQLSTEDMEISENIVFPLTVVQVLDNGNANLATFGLSAVQTTTFVRIDCDDREGCVLLGTSATSEIAYLSISLVSQ